ncbi:CopD family protein [Streptomyces sp. NPDC051940]|uniref:copper resistance D family protein n=1 Tax=Streptomyces sp. NPDC051940 TaxID=3155675 RepID=UPI00341B2809
MTTGELPRHRPALALGAGLAAAAAALAAALIAATGRTRPVPGIAGAGRVTDWGLPVARAAADAGAVATVGALLLGGVLLSGPHAVRQRAARWAGAAAGMWAVASAAVVAFTLSDLVARPVWSLDVAAVARFATADPHGRAHALTAATAALLAALCPLARTRAGARCALLVALAAVLPPVLSGHSAVSGHRGWAMAALGLHLWGVSVWMGGLLAVFAVAVRADAATAEAVRRFSPLAAIALAAVATSGALSAALRLPSTTALLTTSYGTLLLAKTTALATLTWCGHRHRTHTLPALTRADRRAFIKLAAAELTLMTLTLPLAVTLSRTPTPS